MLNSKKIFLVLVSILFFSIPYLVIGADTIIWTSRFNIDKCTDWKGYYLNNKKPILNKCCLYMGEPSEGKWVKQANYTTCTIKEPAAGWDCYCRPYNLKSENQNTDEANQAQRPLQFAPQVSVPDSDFTSGETYDVPENTALFSEYIVAIFKYSIGIVGIISTIVLMFGGIRWLTAGGNNGIITEARNYIIGSLSGLILSLGSFLLLSTINTNLVNFKIKNITPIKEIDLTLDGCCAKYTDKNKDKAILTTEQTDFETCRAREKDFPLVEFFYGLRAEANKCVLDKTKYACCLYGRLKGKEDKLTDLYLGCMSEQMIFDEYITDFTNRCKELSEKEYIYRDEVAKGEYKVELERKSQSKGDFCECVMPEE